MRFQKNAQRKAKGASAATTPTKSTPACKPGRRVRIAALSADPADGVFRAIPPVPQKLVAAVDRLPAAFRLDLDPDTTFSATLN